MNKALMTAPQNSVRSAGPWAAAFSLIFLAPMIAEVLNGSTRVSYIYVLIPEMMVWGCGALLIREAARRWGGGGTSMLLMALGLSVAEEFIIQQTSLAPLPWLHTLNIYGRQWGVNWLYFLFMLGYESVWVVLVPVQVTELIFPKRRSEPWLSRTGVIVSSATFLIGSYIAWYSWVKVSVPLFFHQRPYEPPVAAMLAGLLIIVVLVLFAFLISRRSSPSKPSIVWTPPAWGVGLAVFVFGLPWYILLTLVFAPNLRPTFSFWIVMACGVAWALLAYLAIRKWSCSPQWTDSHRWALTFAATLVCMGGGFLGSSAWLCVDLIGKAILNLIAVVGFIVLLILIRKRGIALPEDTV